MSTMMSATKHINDQNNTSLLRYGWAVVALWLLVLTISGCVSAGTSIRGDERDRTAEKADGVGGGGVQSSTWHAEAGSSVSDWVRSIPAIARVAVVDIGPALYNSPTGLVPTPDSQGEWDFGAAREFIVYRTIVLDILEPLKGSLSGVDGLVVLDFPEHESSWPPDLDVSKESLGFGITNTVGIVFMGVGTDPRDWSPEEMSPSMARARTVLLSRGEEYVYAGALNFYRFEGNNATSEIDGRTMPISQLESEINDELNP